MTHHTAHLEITLPRNLLEVSFPTTLQGLDQNEEWFEVEHEGRRHRSGLHDYAAIYGISGLYESLVYQALKCRSPEQVIRPLEMALTAHEESPQDLRVLDLGAGNGIVGELLRQVGVRKIVGIDILPEAATAAKRDRPQVYDDSIVADLGKPRPATERRLRAFAPNCLVTVAALGFGDIHPEAFVRAFNLLTPGGWLAMCIKDRFLEEDDESGFGTLVRKMAGDGTLDVLHRKRYVHRLSITGEKYHYVAVIARKQRDAQLRA